jgi:competence protein ComEC
MGLALGDDSRLDPVLERDFRATGLSHLLVVSGENIADLGVSE